LTLILFCMAGLARAELGPPPELDLPFPVGERLTYIIYWGWVGVGTSVATTEWVEVEDEWRLRIQFRTTTNHVLRRIYPVDDTVEVYVHPETLRPEKFIMDLSEGRHKRQSRTDFDWEAKEAVYTRFREDRDDEKETVELVDGVRDLVSFMYFMRQTPFEDGETYEFDVLSDSKIYQLTVSTHGYEQVRLRDYGRVRSLKMVPKAQFEGVFVRRGEMVVWLSDDDRRLLTKLELDTPFANVRLILREVEGPEAERWAEEN